ncbi:hypothetical protein LLH06_16725 [Mucilaginibacter daejeonensis]|uniref:hypothetical protein n=1 Tax=Mucilaginibacter daejeonensis TaxID=398049 RepID=UPI001D1759CE|nr:hypothetical protein [Mucilaginibacter daejeonensis]UEG52601.1 hypothetical protein LLH06_16725 [Mucilaginibacter daejeonensis]
MKSDELIRQLDYLISLAANAKLEADGSLKVVDYADRIGFSSAGLSFIGKLYGEQHSYYTTFTRTMRSEYESGIRAATNILQQIKVEVEQGWLYTIRQLVTADIFSDFLEMSEHLLEEGYKDAAAVMIGSTLEEHLRELCDTYKIQTKMLKGSDEVPKKADTLNSDLKKAEAYNALDQKQVTAWLGIRNSAAHGKYDEYTKEQVQTMYIGVLNFISRVK